MKRPSFRNRVLFASQPASPTQPRATTRQGVTKPTYGVKPAPGTVIRGTGPQYRPLDASVPTGTEVPQIERGNLLAQVSYRGSLVYNRTQFFPYNPDDLSSVKPQGTYPQQSMWIRHGPHAVYRRMLTDEQVKGCLTYKILARVSHGWTLTPADKTQEAQRVSDFVKENLDRVDGTFHTALKEIMSALAFGFSVTEKIYRLCDSGKWYGNIMLAGLKTRAPETFRFETDEFGNVRALTQLLPTTQTVMLPRDKFVVYTYHGDFQNPYGQSDLRAAYRAWWSKDFVIKAWNIFLDRFGSPTRVMKLPSSGDGQDEAVAQKALSLLESIQTDTSITLPPGFEMEFKAVGSSGNAGYEEALDRYDRSIAKALLYPELGGLTERRSGGSQHMAESQMTGYDLVLMDLGLDLEEIVVMQQIVRPLVAMNFGPHAPVPLFKLGSMTRRDTDSFAKVVGQAVKDGVLTWRYEDEASLRKSMDLSEIDQAQWEAGEKKRQEAGGGGAPAGFTPPPGAAKFEAGDGALMPKWLATKGEWRKVPPAKGAGRRELTRFEQRYDFAALDRADQQLKDTVVARFGMLIADAARDATDFVRRKGLLQDPRAVKEILKWDFDETPVRKLLDSTMLALYLWGKQTVCDALRESGRPVPLKFASEEDLGDILGDDEYVDMDAICDAFAVSSARGGSGVKMAVPFQKGELARVKDKFHVKAHAIAGQNKTTVLSTVQRMLQKAVDEGWSFDTWKYNLDGSLGKLAGTVFGQYPGGDDATHAQTTFRTIMNETLNEGRLAAMMDPALGVPVAGVQFSAILDNATTEICEAADGVCLKLGNPNLITPPLHFNCRTLIIEILEDEAEGVEWADKLPVPPAKGFGTHDFCGCVRRFQVEEHGPESSMGVTKPVEPAVIYTHGADLDGLLSGILARQLAMHMFGRDVPVKPVDYQDLDLLDTESPCWICDLSMSGKPAAMKGTVTFFDHHGWDTPPAGPSFIESDEQHSTVGVLREVWKRLHDIMPRGLAEPGPGERFLKFSLGVPSWRAEWDAAVDLVQAGDLYQVENPVFETARDVADLMSAVGWDVMWARFKDAPAALADLPEQPALRAKRERDNAEGVKAAKDNGVQAPWGWLVKVTVGNPTDVMTALSRQWGETVGTVFRRGDGWQLSFKSAQEGGALKAAKRFGGGGHPCSAGASLQAATEEEARAAALKA